MRESKNFCTDYLTKFSINLHGIFQLRLVCVMNLILILWCPFHIQLRDWNLVDFIKKKPLNIGLYLDNSGPISFKLGLVLYRGHYALHFDISFDDLDKVTVV